MCEVAEALSQRKVVWREGNDMVNAISRRTATKGGIDHQRQASDYRCKKCNRQRKPCQYFAYGKRCNSCNMLHHFAVCCPAHIRKDEVGEVSEQIVDDAFDILEVGDGSRMGNDWKVTAYLASQEVLFKCYPNNGDWIMVKRNYPYDPHVGGSARCVKYERIGPVMGNSMKVRFSWCQDGSGRYGCAMWRRVSHTLSRRASYCDFIFDLFCGGAPKYQVYDQSCSRVLGLYGNSNSGGWKQ
ncbi:hypothetical protein HPB49_020740 [Dermacentor silvarum]|uniref:Uncharacterized protein n=1 Tax=Dermacentor silvarum TaxID=543639 RepID=A0ACB8C5D3_DERSI|nr:hypothetical protein HPB49_020740 [Dermacentor silvarum]